MRVLAFDTCLNACSAAVAETSGTVVAARCEAMRVGHAERLLPMIDEVLAGAGCTLADIEAIAVTVGPGTFTGIRVGIAAARGFALAADLPVLGTTSLALLAATARAGLAATDRSRPVAACHDARKGEVLVEIIERFRGDASLPPAPSPQEGGELVRRVRLLTPEATAALIASSAPDALLVGSGAALVSDAARARGVTLTVVAPGLEPDARHLACLPLLPLEPPTPLYPRPPDAKPPADPALTRTP